MKMLPSLEHMRILIYSHDTFGLGNIRRMLAIANYLIATDPNVSVLVLSGSPMLHAFRLQPRIDYVKLPCLCRDTEGVYTAKSLRMDYEKLIQLRSNLILSAVLDFEPDLLLVDKKPLGVSNELAAAMDMLRRRGSRAKSILLLRDILGSPEKTCEVWSKNRYHDAIAEFYDQILVVGSPDIFDVRKEYKFLLSSAVKTHFCGYIRRELSTCSRDAVRKELGLTDERLVLVTAGGGEDGHQLLSCYLRGLDTTETTLEFHTLLLCGPDTPEEQRHSLSRRVAGRNHIQVKEFTDDIMAYMNAAEVVVSMGGYNTVCELLTLKKRAIVVPHIADMSLFLEDIAFA